MSEVDVNKEVPEVDVNKEVPEVDVNKEVPEVDVNKSWYVIHTYSGFEQKVKISLEEQFERSSSREALGEIIIPVEDVVEVRKGKKKVSSRKFFPGYILISVDMSRDIWYMIKNTAKVTGFLGSGGKPVPLSEDEVKTIKGQISGETSQPKPKFSFEKGESVRVVEGPFINFNGTVDEVNQSKGKVRVMVSIFGRATPVELEFPQIEAV
jgi:transcriptional antiterminator NusG